MPLTKGQASAWEMFVKQRGEAYEKLMETKNPLERKVFKALRMKVLIALDEPSEWCTDDIAIGVFEWILESLKTEKEFKKQLGTDNVSIKDLATHRVASELDRMLGGAAIDPDRDDDEGSEPPPTVN